jgi:protein-disulfide isomerase
VKLNHLLNAGTAVMVLCALVVTGLLVRRELAPAATAQPPRTVTDWRRFSESGHRTGPAVAPVTITEFSDFECPFCRNSARALAAMQARYPNQLAVVFRHMPLHVHRFALRAAHASECAARQERFAAMHDTLFGWQDSLGLTPWPVFAAAAGVPDTAAFARCMGERATNVLAAVARDTIAAHELGITGTPALLINDQFIQGAPPARDLDALIQQALAARPH